METGSACPKISVVVPIYNIEKYVDRCVTSILRQTYSNTEIILVDDGSTDGSSALCDQYQRSAANVQVIHQENQGLSAARNAGTAAASGEYIVFIDGDDYICERFLSTLWGALYRNKAQMAVCGMAVVRDGGSAEPGRRSCRETAYSRAEALSVMLYQKQFDVSACGKLYPIGIARQHPFPIGRVYEDILPVTQMVSRAERVVWLPAKLYCYYQRRGSIMHSGSAAQYQDELDMTDAMYDYVSQTCPAAEPAALCKKFSNYCQVLAAVKRSKDAAQMGKLRERIMKFLCACAPRVACNSQARYKNRLAATALWVTGVTRGFEYG